MVPARQRSLARLIMIYTPGFYRDKLALTNFPAHTLTHTQAHTLTHTQAHTLNYTLIHAITHA